MGTNDNDYRKKYYQDNKAAISAKSKKRHKKTYKPRKRKTAMAKEVTAFSELINTHNISINFN